MGIYRWAAHGFQPAFHSVPIPQRQPAGNVLSFPESENAALLKDLKKRA
jgi:hypothetical protein